MEMITKMKGEIMLEFIFKSRGDYVQNDIQTILNKAEDELYHLKAPEDMKCKEDAITQREKIEEVKEYIRKLNLVLDFVKEKQL